MHGAIWKTPSGAQNRQPRNPTAARLNALFPPSIFFFSWDVAARVLCYFQLAVARCANARLGSVSLLLARQLNINQAKTRAVWTGLCWPAASCGGPTLGVFFPFFPPDGGGHHCNIVVWPCVCVSLWEALQEPSWPELPLYAFSPGRGGGRGPRGDRGTTHSSAAWGAEEWVTL